MGIDAMETIIKEINNRMIMIMSRLQAMLGVVFITTFFTANISAGQTGTIGGSVYDTETGKPLSAVVVTLQGVGLTAVSDADGRYHLRSVPDGNHTLEVSMPGYESQQVSVSVSAGARTIQNMELDLEHTEGDRLFVRKRRAEWSQAMARQKNTPVISHAITGSQMIQSGDYSIQDGLARVPGVQVGRQGELNIRGVGRNMYDVTVDGQRMPSTTPPDRFVDLGTISAEMAQDVEVVKVLTPDMDAHGVAGVVRINSWRPVGDREINVRAGGLANPRYNRYTGLGNRGSLHYAERYRDDFSMALSLSYQQDTRGFEGLEIGYDAADFGAIGARPRRVDVIEQLAPRLNTEERSRFGGRLQMNYQPDEQTTYYVQGLMTTDNRSLQWHRNISSAKGDWIDQTTTGDQGAEGTYTYDAFLGQGNDYQFMVQAGGRHLLEFMDITYRAGWTHSRVDHNRFDFFFLRENLDYVVDMEDRTRPRMQITNIPLMEDGSLDQRFLNFEPTERIRDEQEENRYSARIDLEAPLGPVSLKAGASGLFTQKGRSYEEADISPLRRYNLLRFHKIPRGSFDVFDEYFLPWVIHTEDVASFIDTSRPDMRMDENDMLKRSRFRNYFHSEYIYGAYGMATLELGRFTLLGGVRLEHTDADYEGEKVTFNHFDHFSASLDTVESVSYTNLFPNAQLMVSPTESSNLKLAYSRSLIRQDYNLLAPFELITPVDTTLFKGNPHLDPIISDNIDVMYEQYLPGMGGFGIGAFYKEFSNRVYLDERTVTQSEFPFITIPEGETIDVTEYQYRNSDDKITVYGVELSWRHYLRFLPGFLSNLGVNANYTWTDSAIEDVRAGEDLALAFQSPHVVNAALDYSQGRFFGQLAWHWSAPALFQAAHDLRWAPAINQTEKIYLDMYEDGWTDLSATFELRLSDRFRVWSNVSNLFSIDRIKYGEERDIYPFETYLREGFRFNAGLQFTL